MAPVPLALIIIHGLAILVLLIALAIQLPKARTGAAQVTWLSLGAAIALVLSGFGLTINLALHGEPNWLKLAIKLAIALSIAFGLYLHRGRELKATVIGGMMGLVLVNAAIAVLW